MDLIQLMKSSVLTASFIALAVGLCSCGVKSSPSQPDGATYPRQYPAALPPLQVSPRAEKEKSKPAHGDIYQYPNQPPAR
jgi:hypothetical protein